MPYRRPIFAHDLNEGIQYIQATGDSRVLSLRSVTYSHHMLPVSFSPADIIITDTVNKILENPF